MTPRTRKVVLALVLVPAVAVVLFSLAFVYAGQGRDKTVNGGTTWSE